jgi:hypothetical protein
MSEACFSCEEDIQDPDPDPVGFQVTAESGPEGRPLYRCAACDPTPKWAPVPPTVISPELTEAIAYHLGAEVLRDFLTDQGRTDR